MTETLTRDPLEKPGGIYCSSKCGFDCKREAYDRAVREADELAARMGDGWTPHVWENCGWCYMVSKGQCAVHPHRHGSGISGDWTVRSYTAYFYAAPGVSPYETADDPVVAVKKVVPRVREVIDTLNASLADLGEVE